MGVSNDMLPIDIASVSDPTGTLSDIAKEVKRFVDHILQRAAELEPGERFTIAAWTSHLNGCRRSGNIHAKMARSALSPKGAAALDRLLNDADPRAFPRKMRSLLALSKAVQESALGVEGKHIKAARAAGACDRTIHDTALITAAICMYNRYFDGLLERNAIDFAQRLKSIQTREADVSASGQLLEVGSRSAGDDSKQQNLRLRSDERGSVGVDATSPAEIRHQFGKAKKKRIPGTPSLAPASRPAQARPPATRPPLSDALARALSPAVSKSKVPIWLQTPTETASPRTKSTESARADCTELNLTKHASERKRQRGVTAEALEVVRRFGEEFHDRETGADVYWLSTRAVRRHSTQMMGAIHEGRFKPQDLERAKGLAIITQGNAVLTQYRAQRPKASWIPSGL